MTGDSPFERRLRVLAGHLGAAVPSDDAAPHPGAPRIFSCLAAADCEREGLDVEDAEEVKSYQRYCEEGRARAMALGNRGPLRFDADGRVARDILEAYWQHGFYVLEGVVSGEELEELRAEFEELHANAPVTRGGQFDRHGRPVKHPGIYMLQRPLSDPMGGTRFGVHNFKGGKTQGRHQMKMFQPSSPPGAPELIAENIVHPLAYMDSALRLAGHPQLLRVAEAINGPDFTPFTESLWYKPARMGTSTAWHQDPSSAWDEAWSQPGFDPGACGFSFHVSVYRCVAENALWMVPGSQHGGRADIKALFELAGNSDRLTNAVPIICEPGDVYIQNRMALHGAFPNRSPEPRATLQFGFNRRTSVLGVCTKGYSGGAERTYDEAYIQKRSQMIGLAIDARRQRFPHEVPYRYQPLQGLEDRCRWSERLKEDAYGEYWQNDIVI